MGDKPQTAGGSKMLYMILAIVGILLAIVGIAEFTIRGMPGRGSGIGAVSLVIGIVLLLFGLFRFSAKPAQ